MGVHGLSSFIKKNSDLLQDEHQLHNTHLVIDGFNMLNTFIRETNRTDLFGGDMVEFGSVLNKIFANFERCKIVPILVMDGAQTYEASKSKVDTKLSRSRQRFEEVLKINHEGYGPYVQPTTANIIFKSIAVDRGIKIYQSFFEADMEAVRLASEYKCPILSEDSDFFLVDLPYGMILTSTMGWLDAQSIKKKETEMKRRPEEPEIENTEPEFFISCKLYKREYFKRYLPNLDVECLPLLGPLLGNDFVSTETFGKICRALPSRIPIEYLSPHVRRTFQYPRGQHEKIIKVLCYCCDKTSSQVIDQLSENLPRDRRSDFKETIRSSVSTYTPVEDTYTAELMKIYEKGFRATYAERHSGPELDSQCVKTIQEFSEWLINCAEKSVMTHKVLELLNENVIFVRPFMDDLTLPSSMNCRYRIYLVLHRLLRPSTASKKPIEIYNRVGNSFGKTLLQQLHTLDEFGPIDYLAYDIPTLPLVTRRDIVLATFHFNHERFVKELSECDLWFEPKHGAEFMTIWMIFDYIDIECPDAKLLTHFRQATLLCLVYYLAVLQPDETFKNRLEELDNSDFANDLKTSIKSKSLSEMPSLGPSRLFGNRTYNCRIMHQISQLQASIEVFTILNAFLGDPLTRIRAEYWLNSCLIYNLTEAFVEGLLKVPGLPDIITRGMTSSSDSEIDSLQREFEAIL